MKDYVFVYRADYSAIPQGTPQEMEAMTSRWMDWMGGIAAQNKLTDRGSRLHNTGRVVTGNQVVTNGPYTEIKESLGGFSIIKAASYDEAVALAAGCPILDIGGNVEVREVHPM